MTTSITWVAFALAGSLRSSVEKSAELSSPPRPLAAGGPAAPRLLELPPYDAPVPTSLVRAEVEGSTLRVEVLDYDTRPPALQLLDGDSTSGRGLHIVADVAERWGWSAVEGDRTGKVVWAELTLLATSFVIARFGREPRKFLGDTRHGKA